MNLTTSNKRLGTSPQYAIRVVGMQACVILTKTRTVLNGRAIVYNASNARFSNRVNVLTRYEGSFALMFLRFRNGRVLTV